MVPVGFEIRVANIHAGSDINNMLVCLLDICIIFHQKGHCGIVDFVRKNNISSRVKCAILTHLDIFIVGILNFLDRRLAVHISIRRIEVPTNGSQT